MINVTNLTKIYGKNTKKSVDGLNLEVRDGEIFGFLGPNGAGKSTTIKMITGILEPTEGDVQIGGVSIRRDPIRAKMKFGYVPDNHAVYEKLTGVEYLNFMANIYGVSESDRRERMDKYLTSFGLKDAAMSYIKTYSHGMKQKICIAGALMNDPDLWILDEPMTGLDPQSAFNLKEMMREHTRRGKTVFFSSHILEVVEKICDRIAIIDDGKLVAVGTVSELREGGASLEEYFLKLTNRADEAVLSSDLSGGEVK